MLAQFKLRVLCPHAKQRDDVEDSLDGESSECICLLEDADRLGLQECIFNLPKLLRALLQGVLHDFHWCTLSDGAGQVFDLGFDLTLSIEEPLAVVDLAVHSLLQLVHELIHDEVDCSGRVSVPLQLGEERLFNDVPVDRQIVIAGTAIPALAAAVSGMLTTSPADDDQI